MHLAEEVREQIQAFVDRQLGAGDLSDFLDSVAPEVHVADDAAAAMQRPVSRAS